MEESIRLAGSLGLKVSVGFEDATRADLGFLTDMALFAEEAGAVRVRLADTVGIASPTNIASLVAGLGSELSSCEIAIHTHNDFGMATANAVAGLEAGAVWADSTILGLGERAGCSKLEELVGFLSLTCGDSTLHPEHLRSLAGYVAGITGRSVSGTQPLLGEDIFTCETGLHLQGLQSDPKTYEPYSPQRVGAKRKLLFGAKSGRKAVTQLLYGEGEASISQPIKVSQIEAIRLFAREVGRSLDKEEMLACISSGE